LCIILGWSLKGEEEEEEEEKGAHEFM